MIALRFLPLLLFLFVAPSSAKDGEVDLDTIKRIGELAILFDYAKYAKGEESGVCTHSRPSAAELTTCGNVDGGLSPYLLRVADRSWNSTDAAAAGIIELIAICLESPETPPATQECKNLARDFVCRSLYPPCDPISHRPKPFCRDDCLAINACIVAPVCVQLVSTSLPCTPMAGERKRNDFSTPLPSGWLSAESHDGKPYYFSFDHEVVQWNKPTEPYYPEGFVPMNVEEGKFTFTDELVSDNKAICAPLYKHTNDAVLEAVIGTENHLPHCTFIPKAEGHKCARDGYVKLIGSRGDVYLHPNAWSARVQPAGSDPEDGFIPAMRLDIMQTAAVTRIGTMDKKPSFDSALETFSLENPEIDCSFTDQMQKVTYTNYHPSGAVIAWTLSIAAEDRIVDVGVGNLHLVPAGAFKFSLNATGVPFSGGKFPQGSTDMVLTSVLRSNHFPTYFDQTSESDVDTKYSFEFVDGAKFDMSMLRYAKIDGETSSRVWLSFYEDLNLGGTVTDQCLNINMPFSLPAYEKYLWYDPDISFVYGDKQQREDESQQELGPMAEKIVENSPGGSGVIVAVVVVALLCIVGALAGFLVVRHRKRTQEQEAAAESKIRHMEDTSNNHSSLPSAYGASYAETPSENSFRYADASYASSPDTGTHSDFAMSQTSGANDYSDFESSRYEMNSNRMSPTASTMDYGNVATGTQETLSNSPSYVGATFSTNVAQPAGHNAFNQNTFNQTANAYSAPAESPLVTAVQSAARGTDPRQLAAAVKNLVVSAKPTQGTPLHAQCVLLGREARDACGAMPQGALSEAQIRRLHVIATKIDELM